MGAACACFKKKQKEKYCQTQHQDENQSIEVVVQEEQEEQKEENNLQNENIILDSNNPEDFVNVEDFAQPKSNNNDRTHSKKLNEDSDKLEVHIENEVSQLDVENNLNQIDRNDQKTIRWKEGEQIGQGSFGRVIIGLNSDTGQVMAVKQVFIDNNQDSAKIIALQKEISLLSQLSHKNIVKYFGMEQTSNNINIFLEYVSGYFDQFKLLLKGGSVQSMLKKFGKFKESLIRVYLKQILKGLSYLHSKGVLHRDIKASNILVDNYGKIKLADFGSSKYIGNLVNLELQGSLCGTPNYMAPEVVNQKQYGTKADVWSLGCTLIEMASGRPPWSEFGNVLTIMLKIAKATEPPSIPSNLSNEAQSFLLSCLKINPSERWTVDLLQKHPFLTSMPKSTKLLGKRQKKKNQEKLSDSDFRIDYPKEVKKRKQKRQSYIEQVDNQIFQELIPKHQQAKQVKKQFELKDEESSHDSNFVQIVVEDPQLEQQYQPYTNVIQINQKESSPSKKKYLVEVDNENSSNHLFASNSAQIISFHLENKLQISDFEYNLEDALAIITSQQNQNIVEQKQVNEQNQRKEKNGMNQESIQDENFWLT